MTRRGVGATATALILAAALTMAGCSNTGAAKEGFGLEPGEGFDVELLTGKVVVSPTGSVDFDLSGRSRVPAGTRVDARRGAVEITAARPGDRTEKARASGGLFALESAAGGAKTRLVAGEGGTGDALKLSGPASFTAD